MSHRLIMGSTGSGKSTYLIDLLLAILHSMASCVLIDPHRRLAEKFIAICLKLGKADRLFVDDLDRMDRAPQWDVIPRSASAVYFIRMQENQEFSAPILDAMAAERNVTGFGDRPNLDKYSKLGFAAYQNLDRWMSPLWIGKTFQPFHAAWRFVCHYCTDDETKSDYLEFHEMPKRERVVSIEAGGRLFDQVFRSAMLMARTCKPPTVSLKGELHKGKIVVLMGGANNPRALRTFVASMFQQFSYAARERDHQLWHWIVDEANNYGLIGAHESRGLSTLRGYNAEVTISTQSDDFPSPEITRNVHQNTPEQRYFHQNDAETARNAAAALLQALDEYKVHHTDVTTKQIHLGIQEVERIGKGKWKGPNDTSGESENTTIIGVPIYGEKEEKRDVYESGNEQLLFLARSLMNQLPGQCWLKKPEALPEQIRVRMWPDMWQLPGLAEKKVQEFLTWQTTLPAFVKPELILPDAPYVDLSGKEQTVKTEPKPRRDPSLWRRGTTSRKKTRNKSL